MTNQHLNKLIVLICFLFFGICLFGQKLKNISYGIEINPKIITQPFDQSEITEFSNLIVASGVANIYLDLNPRYSLKSGISLNLLRIDQLDYSITFNCDIHGGMVDIESSWIRTNYSNLYLGFPLENKMNLNTKKNHPYVKVGGEFLFLVAKSGGNKVYECGTSIIENPFPDFEPFPVLFLLDLGLGYEFDGNRHRKFYFEPQIEYSVDRIFRTQPSIGNRELVYNSKIFNIGIAAGVRFK